MKKFFELDLGFSDAENYKRRENKDLFNRVFLRNEPLERLCKNDIYFLVGEKGTGKTAYAVFLANNNHKDISAAVNYIRETDYQKFLELKKQNHLSLSNYTSIWRTILLLLMAKKIQNDEKGKGVLLKKKNFNLIQDAIDEYYHNAFAPEILMALQITEETKLFAELISKHLRAGGEEKEIISFTEKRFQANLFYIEKKLMEAISAIKTSHRHTLFIDGIDIRPTTVPYNDYLECIKGLANAVWSLNNDFFANIRDSKYHQRIVLLVRPDILESIGLQNTNTKIRDNSVVLDWKTTYPKHRDSDLYLAIDRWLSAQKDKPSAPGDCWDHYFTFNSPTDKEYGVYATSFISFLRFSLFRPRDIIVMMDIIQKEKVKLRDYSFVKLDDFDSAEFRKAYGVYFLGEVKEQLSFYHSEEEYEAFLKFFEFLHGNFRFDYIMFLEAFDQLTSHLNATRIPIPDFFDSPNRFLQYLFDLNVISYLEIMEGGDTHVHWCYRERSYANLSPKVKTYKTYEIHYGLGKVLNLGKKIRR